jgi:four helix bundle protein
MNYKDLDVWKIAQEVVIEVHEMTLNDLPAFKLYETGSQIRRSTKSTKTLIVEGYGRLRYKQDFIKFLIQAHASNNESRYHLETLFETKSFKNEEKYNTIHEKIDILRKKLFNFIKTVEKEHIVEKISPIS